MKRIVLHDKRAALEECPTPEANREWVVVRVMASPICGSDKKAYYSSEPVRTAGHEGTGVVVDASGSSILKDGDRVVLNPLSGCGSCELCRTGNYIYCKNKPPYDSHFAEYLRIQDFVCTPLPDDISFEVGSLAGCALGPAFNAARRMRLSAFESVLITGLGPVGMGALTISKYLGARVIAVDVLDYRKKMAERLGADLVLDARDPDVLAKIASGSGDRPLTNAIDASGNEQAERLCIEAVIPRGCVAFIGENNGEIPVSPSNDFLRKGLTLMGAWHYNLNDASAMMTILRSAPHISELITDVYGLEDAQTAFDQFVTGSACKVLLKP